MAACAYPVIGATRERNENLIGNLDDVAFTDALGGEEARVDFQGDPGGLAGGILIGPRIQRRHGVDFDNRAVAAGIGNVQRDDGPALTSAETRVAIIEAGKNAWVVRRVLGELGCEIASDEREAEALVIGTLSPGPMLDACDRHRGSAQPVIVPWILRQRADAVDHVCRV